jgi:CheY-like chemotaxis protein
MHRPRVLLVEDNLLFRWWMLADFDRAGFFVMAPNTVEEALRLGTRAPFDILVTDWRLSGGHDGFEVLERVRQRFPDILAVLISAEADAGLTRRAKSAGFDFVLQKPFPSATMIDLVRALTAREPSEVAS